MQGTKKQANTRTEAIRNLEKQKYSFKIQFERTVMPLFKQKQHILVIQNVERRNLKIPQITVYYNF